MQAITRSDLVKFDKVPDRRIFINAKSLLKIAEDAAMRTKMEDLGGRTYEGLRLMALHPGIYTEGARDSRSLRALDAYHKLSEHLNQRIRKPVYADEIEKAVAPYREALRREPEEAKQALRELLMNCAEDRISFEIARAITREVLQLPAAGRDGGKPRIHNVR